MTEPVRFHFDPICPWCYQTSRWVRVLEQNDLVEITWSLYSLTLAHYTAERPISQFDPNRGQGIKALRVAALVDATEGNDAMGRFYSELGRCFFEGDEPVELGDQALLTSCLKTVGLDTGIVERALEDESVWRQVLQRHEGAVDEGVFGVPWITRASGRGFFGPVLSEPTLDPSEATEMWDHLAWLSDRPNFAELKLIRTAPTLPYYRRTFGTQV